MDTFSQILKALAVRCYLSEERTWKQAETADFSAYDGVRLLFVFQGSLTCTFRLGTDPVTVQAGEALALFRPSAYRLQSSDTEDTLVAVGQMRLDAATGHLFYNGMPPFSVITPEKGAQRIGRLMAEIAVERRSADLGSEFATSRLIDLVMLDVLRGQLTNTPTDAQGLFAALRDPKLVKALTVLHAAPQTPWTLTTLAETAGMSRAAFAARFKQRMGIPPLEYLARWRIQLAVHALRTTDDTVKIIARRLGFSSPAVFTAVFKRIEGCTPTEWRTAHHHPPIS